MIMIIGRGEHRDKGRVGHSDALALLGAAQVLETTGDMMASRTGQRIWNF